MSLELELMPATFQCPRRELLQIVAPLTVSQCLETIEIFTTADARTEERSVPIETLGFTSDISKLPVKIELTPYFFSIALMASMSNEFRPSFFTNWSSGPNSRKRTWGWAFWITPMNFCVAI